MPPTAQAAMSIQVITSNNIRAMRKQVTAKKSGWEKPRVNFVMINVDAAFDENTKTG